MATPDALNAVITRNEFYRDGYRRLQKIALAEALAILGLILVLALTISVTKGKDRFFATTSDGRLLQMVPLDQPNLPTAKLVSWAAASATEIMTFGFNDYRKRLQDSSRLFTHQGWLSFNDALHKSNLLQMMQQNQQVLTAVPREAPVVVQEGVVHGVYRWYVQLPLNITYQVGNRQENRPQLITMAIVRVSTLETPDGVAVDQWIAGDLQ
jgi:intracellular multiplication protein IcmL